MCAVKACTVIGGLCNLYTLRLPAPHHSSASYKSLTIQNKSNSLEEEEIHYAGHSHRLPYR